MDTRAITVRDRRNGLVGSGESQGVASQRRWSNGTQLRKRVGRRLHIFQEPAARTAPATESLLPHQWFRLSAEQCAYL